ncbi:hypothetical protein CEP51_013216 [Fusarium floridanum]|uniref:MARVEL domain-containing protein n=1 Tax=Fusarium floridanum TaxID=1325733 RepID=A0A428QFG0_9HYPO|nr:hypothetical protein CEP51_013216 [Fusarium floridanum]
MNLNVESAYEPYSNQGLFHEMEHGRGGRPSDADSAQLLKKRKKSVQGSSRIIEGLHLLLRVLQLLLGLSILALMLHAAIVWRMTRYKIMDRGSDWIIYQWPHTDMRPTWTMMGIAVGTTLAHIGSLMKCTMIRQTAWRTRAIYAGSIFIIAAWSAALAYFKVSNENAKKKDHQWDLWSWTCNARHRKGEVNWNSLCIEMDYYFITCIVVVSMEVVGLITFAFLRPSGQHRGNYGVLNG